MKIDLVFRSNGERTEFFSLASAIRTIDPDNIYILRNIKPFHNTLLQMLELPLTSEYCIAFDSDCINQTSIRKSLGDEDFIDCWGYDKFRGECPCGIHITRLSIIERMRDLKHLITIESKRPESDLRGMAMKEIPNIKIKNIKIDCKHDFGQFYHHIFSKYVVRGWREFADKVRTWFLSWDFNDLDYVIAKEAIEFSWENKKKEEIIINLPKISLRQVKHYIEKQPMISPRDL